MKDFWAFARDFFTIPPPAMHARGALFSAPGCGKRCPKCSGGSTGLRYDAKRDLLDYHCHDCGYEWSGPPADKKDSSGNGGRDA